MSNVRQLPEAGVVLRSEAGVAPPLSGQRWIDRADVVDDEVLAWADGPVLDLGCGPGRHVEALAERGVIVLGIDLSAHAVAVARQKRLAVLARSVFDAVPKAGEWGTALLLDGNVGIGGNPLRLLRRVSALLRPGGRVLIEVDFDGERSTTERVRLEIDAVPGPWFLWARLGTVNVVRASADVGMSTLRQWASGNRHFLVLQKPLPASASKREG